MWLIAACSCLLASSTILQRIDDLDSKRLADALRSFISVIKLFESICSIHLSFLPSRRPPFRYLSLDEKKSAL